MITQAELKEILKYDPETGIFKWLCSSGSVKAGRVAGAADTRGYIGIRINRKAYLSHRLAWLYVHGVWPKNQIDHINHIRTDNRLDNLREATHQENMRNSKRQKNNTSGVTGVYWCKIGKKHKAVITVDLKVIRLGYFADKFEAICARLSANNKYGFHTNHGRQE